MRGSNFGYYIKSLHFRSMPNTESGMPDNTYSQCYISPLFCIHLVSTLFSSLIRPRTDPFMYPPFLVMWTWGTQSISKLVFLGWRSVFKSYGSLSAHSSTWHFYLENRAIPNPIFSFLRDAYIIILKYFPYKLVDLFAVYYDINSVNKMWFSFGLNRRSVVIKTFCFL